MSEENSFIRHGFVAFPNALFDLELRGNEIAVLLALLKYSGFVDVRPSHQTIAKLSGVGISTVQRSLVSLKEKSVIDWLERKDAKGSRLPNSYRFIHPSFSNLIFHHAIDEKSPHPLSESDTPMHLEADKTLVHSDRPPSFTVTEEIDNINTNKKKLEELDHRSQRPTPRSVTENDKKTTNNSSTEKKAFSKSGIRLLSSIPELKGITKTIQEFFKNGMQKNEYYKKWKTDRQVKKINTQIDILEEAAKQIKNEKLLEKFLLNYLEGLGNGEENYATVPLHMIVHGCEKLANGQKRNQSNSSFSGSANPVSSLTVPNTDLRKLMLEAEAKQNQNTIPTF